MAQFLDWQKGLRTYQIEGVDFLSQQIQNGNHPANFDQPGLGKTAQAIRTGDKLNYKRILVACPAIARINWSREFETFGLLPRTIHVQQTIKSPIPNTADVVIVSHDMLANKHVKEAILNAPEFDLLIVDEAHCFKNRTALRTKALYGERLNGQGGIISNVNSVILLTGTPNPNNSGEFYTHLRALAPKRLETENGRLTYAQFIHRFCQVDVMHFGMRTVERIRGNKNIPELKERLKGWYIRRRKEDVLTELPPLQWGTVVLEPPKGAAKQIKDAEKDPKVKQIQAVLAAASAKHFEKDALLAETLLSQNNATALATMRRIVGLAKVAPVVEFIESEMEATNQGKIILFAYHKEVIAQLAEALKAYKPVVVTGDTSKPQRQKAIDDFQNDEDTLIFIGQITAANSAITLTASSNVLIMEPSWIPAENVQAAARAHRMGQKSDSVLARFITLAGSIDEDITRVIKRKTESISQIMI
jgi:SNF2 family DNA or RNA helicase